MTGKTTRLLTIWVGLLARREVGGQQVVSEVVVPGGGGDGRGGGGVAALRAPHQGHGAGHGGRGRVHARGVVGGGAGRARRLLVLLTHQRHEVVERFL